MALCLLIGIAAFIPFSADLAQAVRTASITNDLIPLLEIAKAPILIFGVLYLLVTAMFWYAPVLVGWHGVPIVRSLFFSFIACWRNKLPLLVYGATWAAAFLLIDLATSLLAMVGLPESIAATIQIPINIVAASVLYCSFYPNYTSVFEAT